MGQICNPASVTSSRIALITIKMHYSFQETQTDPPPKTSDKFVQAKIRNPRPHMRASTPIESSSEDEACTSSDISWIPETDDEYDDPNDSIHR